MSQTLSQSASAILQRLYNEGCQKRSQPKSGGAVYCECGQAKTRVRPGRHGLVCKECQRKDDVFRAMERRSNDVADNERVFYPTPSPLAEHWRWCR